MSVIAISLQSGSSGNCIYIETQNRKLLFDAGISSIQAARRLEAYGRNIRDVDALIISHDHADHVRHAGVYSRRFGLPLYITPKTLESASKRHSLGKIDNISYFSAGEELRFNGVSVNTVPSPHDGVDGVLFIISSNNKRLGIFTDLGHAFQELFETMPSLDAVFVESNYDPEMLSVGHYPAFLKHRIRGPHGHLSNREAAELLQAGNRLRWACLSHLSHNNNNPDIALKTHREIVSKDLTLYTASRFEATGIFKI